MRIPFPWIFRGVAGAEDPARAGDPAPLPIGDQRSAPEAIESSVPVTYMSSGIPPVDSAFGYGHLDGKRGVPPESFREFIARSVESEGIERRIGELEAERRAVLERSALVRERRAELAKRSEDMAGLVEAESSAAALLAARASSLEEAEEHDRAKAATGSLVQSGLFLLAAAVFILGDVVMAREIVADALDLTGNKLLGVVDESWVFATGLAMISIALKPAYDRLVEKPYWEGRARAFVLTIGALALLSFVTLYVLGDFRAESHGNQVRIEQIEANADLSAGEKAVALGTVQERMLASSLGRWSFILSGILFAAAGAMSLGIGLRYARDWRYVRLPARLAAKKARELQEEASALAERLRADLRNRRPEIEQLRTLVAEDPRWEELEARAEALESERLALHSRLADVRSRRLGSLYDDGYQLGLVLGAEAATEAARVEISDERPRRRRPRPFVAVRRAIREAALRPHRD